MKPDISVIITAYNQSAYLKEAIESVAAQGGEPFEIIVVDDGSTDDTATMVAAFGKAIRYHYQPNAGLSAARNRGVKHAQGNFIALLDGDDYWAPGKLEKQLAFLHSNSGIAMVFGMTRQFVSPELSPAAKSMLRDDQKILRGVMASAMLARREVLEKTGEFRIDRKLGEFIDWFARAQELGFQYSVLPEIISHRRLHENNVTRQLSQQRGDYLSVLKAALDRRRARGVA